MTQVLVLGLGEVGTRLVEDILQQSSVTIRVWDKQLAQSDSKPAANFSKFSSNPWVQPVSSAAVAASGCDVILSAVTAEHATDACSAVLPSLTTDTWYVDFNSVSPATKSEMAQQVNGSGGRFIEAAILSPIEPKRLHSPILLSGPYADDFIPLGQQLGFTGMTLCSEEYGKAAATKMCRSVIIKGMEALVSESLIAARHYGVEDAVLESLNNLFPLPDWNSHARYLISRSLEHGTRRAEEMREVAKTVADAGLQPLMSDACAKRQDWAPAFAAALTKDDVHEMLDNILQQMNCH